MPNAPESSAKIIQRGDCGDNVTYTLDENGVLTISGGGPMLDYKMIAPGVADTPWRDRRATITQANIQRGVTIIGSFAFSRCAGLTSVTIPDGVTTIEKYAFGGCAGLTSVTIPDSVTTIGEHAFNSCAGLTSVTIPNSAMTIGTGAFMDCAGLTSVTIPNGVKTIGVLAFYGCAGLTSVTIPDSVTEIGERAFQDCQRLTSVTIPDSVKFIGPHAFDGCDSLTSVSVPAHTKISRGLFGKEKASPPMCASRADADKPHETYRGNLSPRFRRNAYQFAAFLTGFTRRNLTAFSGVVSGQSSSNVIGASRARAIIAHSSSVRIISGGGSGIFAIVKPLSLKSHCTRARDACQSATRWKGVFFLSGKNCEKYDIIP